MLRIKGRKRTGIAPNCLIEKAKSFDLTRNKGKSLTKIIKIRKRRKTSLHKEKGKKRNEIRRKNEKGINI